MNTNNKPFIIFELNGKYFCEKHNEEFIMPNFLDLNQKKTLPAYLLGEDKMLSINIELSCLEVFLGEKKIHFYNGPKQERDKTKGFREKLNRVNINTI